jgi:hypothetical protein
MSFVRVNARRPRGFWRDAMNGRLKTLQEQLLSRVDAFVS